MNNNWKYVPFDQLFEWKDKSLIKSGAGGKEGRYPLFVCSDTEIKRYDDFIIDDEAIVFGTGGKACCHYVNEKFAYSTDCVVATKKDSTIVTKFYYYYFRQNRLGLLQATFKGIGLQHTSKKKINSILVPVVDFVEQNQIVEKIETMLSKLDDGIETLKKTQQQLTVYRQAVLKDAFEGKLSSSWRANNNISVRDDYDTIAIDNPVYKDTSGDENEMILSLPSSWIKLRMGDVFNVEVGATPSRRKPEYWNGTVNWVSSGEVRFNHIYQTNELITEEGLANSSTKIHPIGTVMLAMIGEGKTRGQASILEIPAAHNQNTAAIMVSETPCQPKYIYYFLQMNYENTRRVGSGNNQKALNKERVRALRFPFSSFLEQKEIVKNIESRFSVCESIENTINNTLQQAEALRQSILKQAFEGEPHEKV